MDSSLMKFDTSVLQDVGNTENICPDSPFDPFEPQHLAKALKSQNNDAVESPVPKFSDEYNNLFKKLKELQERSKKLLEVNDIDKPRKMCKEELETSIHEMKKDVSTVKNKLLDKVKNADGCGRSPSKRRFSIFKDDFGDLETSFDLIESSLHFDSSVIESPIRRKSLSVGDLRAESETIPFDVIQAECQKIIDYIASLKEDSFELLSDEPAPMNVSNSSEDEFGLPNVLKTKSSSVDDLSKNETIKRYRKLSLTLNSEPDIPLNRTFEVEKENNEPEIKAVFPIVPNVPQVPKIVKKTEVRPLSRKGPLKAFAPVAPLANVSVSNVTLPKNGGILPKASSTPVTVTRQRSNPLMRRTNVPKVQNRPTRSNSVSRIGTSSDMSADLTNVTTSKPNEFVRSTRSSTLRASMEFSKIKPKRK